MPKLRRHLLARSPEETARRLCLRILEEASIALTRMDEPSDKEALHDFRVALRRLRSLMRAYQAYLRGSQAKKLRQRLKALAGSTNLARDVEVQIDWLDKATATLGEPGASGAHVLISVLAERQATTPSPETLRREFRPLRRDLSRALSRVRLSEEQDAANFVQATADVIREHAALLQSSLATAHSAEDAELLHRARIEAKRLRYVIEPLQHELSGARALVKRLKSLQDLLGELQDTRVLTEEISAALESAALDDARKLRDLALAEAELPEVYPPQNPGLLALLKAQRSRRERAFTELTTGWAGRAGEATFARLDRFVQRLLRWPRQELPKRRFLLTQVPAALRRQRSSHVREGWLPGKEIRERVRATRDGRSLRYSRVVELHPDGSAQETLTRRIFDELWALTEGRRLECWRYELVDGPSTWSIVAVIDRDVVLAEVEAQEGVSVPEAIQSELVREVTGVNKYELEALARSPGPTRRPASS